MLSRERIEHFRDQLINGPSPSPGVVPTVVFQRADAVDIIETARDLYLENERLRNELSTYKLAYKLLGMVAGRSTEQAAKEARDAD